MLPRIEGGREQGGASQEKNEGDPEQDDHHLAPHRLIPDNAARRMDGKGGRAQRFFVRHIFSHRSHARRPAESAQEEAGEKIRRYEGKIVGEWASHSANEARITGV